MVPYGVSASTTLSFSMRATCEGSSRTPRHRGRRNRRTKRRSSSFRWWAGFIIGTHGWLPELFLAVQNTCGVNSLEWCVCPAPTSAFTRSSPEDGAQIGDPFSIAANQLRRMAVADSLNGPGSNKWKAQHSHRQFDKLDKGIHDPERTSELIPVPSRSSDLRARCFSLVIRSAA